MHGISSSKDESPVNPGTDLEGNFALSGCEKLKTFLAQANQEDDVDGFFPLALLLNSIECLKEAWASELLQHVGGVWTPQGHAAPWGGGSGL